MSRGSGGVAEAPRVVEPAADDHRLVAAVRRGDDRAFEALYARYQRRIHAYVLGMVKDHGRAEDVTQEVFVSALRRMRDTERPIAFKPWIYEIAKNACIDQFRRSRRAEELSLEAGDGLGPADRGRIVGPEPAPDDAFAAKQELDHLCGAFGGLSDTHYEVLVMRELEGLSYREIGERLGMTGPAVESTLFRARRRLSEEYGELASGARCEGIQGLIATVAAADARLGLRDSRRLRRHVSHCQPCRREAMAAGLDAALLAPLPLRRRVAEKLAGLLPFGWFGRGRGGGWSAQAPMLSDQVSGGWGKVATAVAVLVAGASAAGVGTQAVRGGGPPARAEQPSAHGTASAAARATRSAAPPPIRVARKSGTAGRRSTATRRSRKSGRAAKTTTTASAPAGTSGSGAGGAGTGGGGSGLTTAAAPASEATAPVRQTVQNVTKAAEPVTKTVQSAGNTVDSAGSTVENAGTAVQPTVNQAAGTVQSTAGQVTGAAQQTVDDTTQKVEDTTGVPVPGVP